MSKAMFAQVCSTTGKGINVGWKVWDEWFSTQELADEYCLRTEGKTYTKKWVSTKMICITPNLKTTMWMP